MEAAIFRGVGLVKTPFSSVGASLSRMTRADQRRSCFECFDFVCCLAVTPTNVCSSTGVPSLAWVPLRVKV
jgi:hypothetical protein